MSEIPAGFCQCGCGQQTKIAPRTWPERGHVKGQHYRFVLGHKARPRLDNYVVEDRGYETPCHIWQGSTDAVTGYARIRVDRRDLVASRYLYELVHGKLPEWPGCHVDHLCRNPSCVRVDHLEAVTAAENIRRGDSTRLTDDEARQIRELCEQGWPQLDIAEAFGVSKQRLSQIKLGRRWAAPGGVVHAAA